ncbi:phosphonate metabolism transcriptional regulator PhnF [Paracoccus suum]|uniref:Phosphonate metabolism transcriptional regulator PhnF n=2 Tax=Paracoccus suum TaxID=2259340 RepID=A0A344PJB2_9RHOB|nr:phosphonate metabolism transcriptional regulator PhnF [Paracoccus suum]
MNKHNWTNIRDRVAERIAAGDYADGTQLPTESQLCAEFGSGRHSVRRAMTALAVDGLLSIEQGRGTFVRSAPLIRYRISKRTRFRENLLAAGRTPSGEHIIAETLPAAARIAEALGLAEGAPVHHTLRRGLADGVPINLNQSWHDAARFPDLAAEREAGRSVTDVYRAHGVADYLRRNTTIYARRPDEAEARLLDQHPDQPVMVLQKTDTDHAGKPIGYSESIWSAHRIQFSIDMLDDNEGAAG